MAKTNIILMVLLIVAVALIVMQYINGTNREAEFNKEQQKSRIIIEGYRDLKREDYQYIDSIKQKRYENDTTNYALSSDSLERLFTERFREN